VKRMVSGLCWSVDLKAASIWRVMCSRASGVPFLLSSSIQKMVVRLRRCGEISRWMARAVPVWELAMACDRIKAIVQYE